MRLKHTVVLRHVKPLSDGPQVLRQPPAREVVAGQQDGRGCRPALLAILYTLSGRVAELGKVGAEIVLVLVLGLKGEG